LAEFDLVITARMHEHIFCARLGVPCIPILREHRMILMVEALGARPCLARDSDIGEIGDTVPEALRIPARFATPLDQVEAVRNRVFVSAMRWREFYIDSLPPPLDLDLRDRLHGYESHPALGRIIRPLRRFRDCIAGVRWRGRDKPGTPSDTSGA
jgi:hypothetical protein